MVKGNLKIKLFESFIGNVAIFILNILFPFLVTKLYGSVILGKYTYSYSIIAMTIFMASLSFDTSLLYFIPRKGKKYVSASFLLNFISSSMIASILFVFIKDNTVRTMLPLIWLASAEGIFFSLYRTNQNIRQFFLVNVLCGIVLKITLCWVLFNLYGANINNLIISTYISYILSNMLYFLKQRNMFEKFEMSIEVIKYSIPLIIGSMMSVIVSNLDTIMIGNVLSKQEVAVYSVAAKLAAFPSIFLLVLNTVFPPIIAKLYHDGELKNLRNMYMKSARTLAAIASVIILVMVIFRKAILGCFGPEYICGQYVIIFVGLGQLVNASVGSVWFIVSMTGRPKLNMIGQILAASINIVANIILIPTLGINGAALASMIAIAFSNFLGYAIVKKILKVKVFGII